MNEMTWITGVVNLGAFGVMSYWWLVIQPRREDRIFQSLDRQLEAFKAEQRFEREQCARQHCDLMESLREGLTRIEAKLP